MAPKKITFENRTEVPITFKRVFKSIHNCDTFIVPPHQTHVISAEVFQTSETFWLLDSANNTTTQCFHKEELSHYTGAFVTEEADGTYLLTKVPRLHTNLLASSLSMPRQITTALQRIPGQVLKWLKRSKEEVLPTRQSGSGSRSPQ